VDLCPLIVALTYGRLLISLIGQYNSRFCEFL
jgi:hypothetical protein